MKELKNLLYVLAAAVFFVVFFLICDRFAGQVREEFAAQIHEGGGNQMSHAEEIPAESQTETEAAPKYAKGELTFSAAGQILIHNPILDYAFNEEDGSFDFSECFIYVKDLLSSSDIAAATLNTSMAGAYNGFAESYAGYGGEIGGYLNTPEALAGNLADAGIDILATAAPHALDAGEAGVASTISYLKEAGIEAVGTAASASDEKERIITKGGLKIAFISATDNVFNNILGDGNSYIINYADGDESIQALCDRISELKEQNDMLILLMNFGNDDSDSISASQLSLAGKVVEAGADAVIGTGSDLVKPMELISVTDDEGQLRNCPVFYGLGSLITSDYYESSGRLVDISAVVDLHITGSGNSPVRIDSILIRPVYCNWTDGKIQPIPVCEARESDKWNDILTDDDLSRINSAYEEIISKMTSGSGLSYEYKDMGFSITVP